VATNQEEQIFMALLIFCEETNLFFTQFDIDIGIVN